MTTESTLLADLSVTGIGPVEPDKSFGFLDLLMVFSRYSRLIAACVALAVTMGFAVAFLLPKTYTASTRLLPPLQSDSVATALMGQLGGLGGLAARDLGMKNPADTYVAMIRSRSVADAIIERFKLLTVYEKRTMTDARKVFDSMVDVKTGKDGTILVSVDDREPGRASAIANEIVAQLHGLTGRLALTESSQRRKFFEGEVTAARQALGDAEGEMQRSQEKTGVMQLDGQAKVMIESVAALRAAIYSKEIELRAMDTFATENNPAVVRARSELAGLKVQFSEVVRKQGGGNGDVLVPTGRLPAAGFEYVDKLRELKYREEVFELMAKQWESAKLDEAKEPAAVQVLDIAVVPDKHSSPKRSLVVLAAGIFGVLGGCWIALCLDALRRRPEASVKLRQSGRYLLGRS